jgi:histidine triad (HIT) family protein
VEKPCVFCAIVRHEKPADRVYEDARVCAFLDASPLFKGHVLVVPKAHVLAARARRRR